MATNSLRLILVTAPEKEAPELARTLLEERLIACANLLPGVQSLYWWEGKIDAGSETLLILKCPARNVKRLMHRVKELHSYSTPEILALHVAQAHPLYAAWVMQEARPVRITRKGKPIRRLRK